MMMVTQSASIQPMAISITTLSPIITIGGTAGTGVHTIITGTIHTMHITTGGIAVMITGMHTIGTNTIGTNTTGTNTTGIDMVHTAITDISDTPTVTFLQTAWLQRQEEAQIYAMNIVPAQPMVTTSLVKSEMNVL